MPIGVELTASTQSLPMFTLTSHPENLDLVLGSRRFGDVLIRSRAPLERGSIEALHASITAKSLILERNDGGLAKRRLVFLL